MSGVAAPETVRLERRGGVARLVLDRPPLNVLDIATMEAASAALAGLRADPAVRVVLLTGAGRAFCAGVDVADHAEDRVDRMLAAFRRLLLDLLEAEVVVVGAVNGAALGGGCELLLACDVVLAREGAKVGLPEVRLGVFPPAAAAWLPGLVGRQRALDLILSGRTLEAREAFELGLVGRVLPAEEFEARVDEYASGLASLSGPVLRLTKGAVRDASGLPPAAGLELAERVYRRELMALPDATEGIAAFVEKRAPVWRES